MRTALVLIAVFFLSMLSHAGASESEHDCSQFKPFAPLGRLKADVTIYRLNKYIPGQGNFPAEEKDEVICISKTPVAVDLKDIRGREADWYFCDKPKPENYLCCDTDYKGKPAKICAKPAMVIRKWSPKDALDTHMHVHLFPESDESRVLDTFTQSIGFDLSQRELTLNGASGGRAPNSDQDAYYVRARIYK